MGSRILKERSVDCKVWADRSTQSHLSQILSPVGVLAKVPARMVMRSGFPFRISPVPTLGSKVEGAVKHRQDAPQFSEGRVKTRMTAEDPTEPVRLQAIQLESVKALKPVTVAIIIYTNNS